VERVRIKDRSRNFSSILSGFGFDIIRFICFQFTQSIKLKTSYIAYGIWYSPFKLIIIRQKV